MTVQYIVAQSLSLFPFHHFDMTKVMLKGTLTPNHHYYKLLKNGEKLILTELPCVQVYYHFPLRIIILHTF